MSDEIFLCINYTYSSKKYTAIFQYKEIQYIQYFDSMEQINKEYNLLKKDKSFKKFKDC